VGVAAAEYAGLSAVDDATVVDRSITATGTTGSSSTVVNSGPTSPTTTGTGLAIGFYGDSGFGTALTGG
jgi:hypothetical protein